MTTAALQQSPVKALTSRLGEETEEVTRLVDRLAAALKAHDHTCDLLNKHGLPQLPDFGTIGNAAARARRALLADADKPSFSMPEAEARRMVDQWNREHAA